MRAAIFITLLFLAGCATVGTKIEQASIDKIIKGQTTKEEAIVLFGKPFSSMKVEDKETFIYSYARAKNNLRNFIPVVDLVSSEMTVDTQTLSITFKDGVVVDYYVSDGAMTTKSGLIH